MALNIIFMGTPDFAVQILSKIYNSKHKILRVYTQSPKKKIEVRKLIYLLFMSIVKKIKSMLDILKNLTQIRNLIFSQRKKLM